jgi:hypothetical protein
MQRLIFVAGIYLALTGCQKDEGATWLRFNGDEDETYLEVTASEDLGDPAVIGLRSTTGATVVGSAVVEPGSGPVGTDHVVTVVLDEAYAERVQRVDMRAASESRGSRLFPMEQDSADLFKWVLDLTSYGVEGEERVDVLSFELYEVQYEPLPETIEDPPTTSAVTSGG